MTIFYYLFIGLFVLMVLLIITWATKNYNRNLNIIVNDATPEKIAQAIQNYINLGFEFFVIIPDIQYDMDNIFDELDKLIFDKEFQTDFNGNNIIINAY